MAALVPDAESLLRFATFKGFGFVLVTAAVLFVLLRRWTHLLFRALDALERKELERREQRELGRGLAAEAERANHLARGLLEALPGIFYLYDRTGRFLRWNQDFERVSGYSGEEIAGMHPLDFFPEEDKSLLSARIEEVFERGESSVEASFLNRSGERLPYFFTGRRVEYDGRTCLIGVGVDIGKRKAAEAQLRHSEERYRTTLDSMLEAGQLIAFDWRYLYLNAAAEGQNRRPNAELLGRRMQEAWPGIESTAAFALLSRCMTERRALQEELEFQFADGSSGWFDIRVQPVPEGIFVLSLDITERRKAAKTLQQLNAELEERIIERTRDLDAAKLRAEAADRLKSVFLATMSHELRTPLNSILGFTGILLQGLAGPLTPEQSKQLGMVRGSARHLLDLINDVLDISKIEAGQLEVRRARFSLRDSVARVTSSVEPLAAKKGLEIVTRVADGLPDVFSDQRRVEQILINLLNNGIKFTDRGRVELEVRPMNGSRLEIAVRDSGIGIRPEDLSRLFQPFQQLDSGLLRQHEGTGLGLAICHRLTELLGGQIEATSEFGKGSTFTLRLPIETEEPT